MFVVITCIAFELMELYDMYVFNALVYMGCLIMCGRVKKAMHWNFAREQQVTGHGFKF